MSAVSIAVSSCLRGAKPYLPCTACSTRCPVDAISFAGHGVAATEDCIGCGACMSSCPAGAIAVSGFEPPSRTGQHTRIECARVPAAALEPDTWIVPCIGGLRIADIVDVAARQSGPGSTIALIDRRLCASCPASRGCNTIAAAFADFAANIARLAPGAIRLGLNEAPLAQEAALPAGTRPAPDRRAFLRALLDPKPVARRSPGQLSERDALAQLAMLGGRELDGSFYPDIAISDDCRDHGICTASCPTGALAREVAGDNDEIRRIRFDAQRCIGCGRCAEICPEHALAFTPAGARARPVEVAILRERRLPVCPKCDEAFATDAADDGLCPACRKSTLLFADLFSSRRAIADGQPGMSGQG